MKTIIKGIIFQDFVNYKNPCMVIEMPRCDFKCDKECGNKVCQNSPLASAPDIEIEIEDVIKKYYLPNSITSAIVFQGLEPFDDYYILKDWINIIRKYTEDDIVIYTGFYKNEIENYIIQLQQYKNIIIKYGRFIPNQESHYDPILKVKLASNNQYAQKIS